MTIAASNTTRIMRQTQKRWHSLLKPYLISTLGFGASVTTGDFICQYLQRDSAHQDDQETRKSSATRLPWWDRKRSLIMCTSAVCVSAPWSFTVSRTIEWLFPGKQTAQIVKKIATNILIAPVGISLVFTTVALLKGQPFDQARAKVKRDMPTTFVNGSFYWLVIYFINYRFIPLDYRPLTNSFAGAIWNIYLSSMANKAHQSPNDSDRSLTRETAKSRGETSRSMTPAVEKTSHS